MSSPKPHVFISLLLWNLSNWKGVCIPKEVFAKAGILAKFEDLRIISLSDIKFFFSGLEKLEQINSPSSPVRSLSVHLKQISGLQG